MNIQTLAPHLRVDHPAPTRLRRTSHLSRSLILDQIIAGTLWMSLDLPSDVSREELETLAHQLVARIRARRATSEIESEFLLLCVDQFGGCADASRIRSLVRRAESICEGV